MNMIWPDIWLLIDLDQFFSGFSAFWTIFEQFPQILTYLVNLPFFWLFSRPWLSSHPLAFSAILWPFHAVLPPLHSSAKKPLKFIA